jgi:ankyrin repeat protein/serine/threonine protein kinase
VKEIEKQITSRYKIDYMKELLAMAKLSRHTELFVHFHGWYENEDTVFLAMEYCGLGDLAACITADSPCSENDAKIITSQLLEGLAVMHEYGFTHRDLKPQNIFVLHRHPEWWVKIGDFGIAKRIQNEDTELRTEVGTRNFKAPEIQGIYSGLEESYEYTNAVDIWSLGCVVHWIICQSVPFHSFNALFVYVEQQAKFPERALHVNNVSDEGIEFIEALMARCPSSRLTASAALENEWIKSVDDIPVPPPIDEDTGPVHSDEVGQHSRMTTPPPIKHDEDNEASTGTEPSNTYSTGSTTATESSNDPGSILTSSDDSGTRYDVPSHHKYVEAAKAAGEGRTPLQLAAFAGDDSAVEKLISMGADVNVEDNFGQTALHRASKRGQTWVADTLIRSGANVNARGQDGATPLWLAAWQGHVDVAAALISNGADLELRTDRDANGARYSPLIVAARNEMKAVVRLLLRKGANIGAQDAYGNTALHHAIQRGDKEMVMLLVDSTADIESKNDMGQGALHLSAINMPAFLAYLKRRGADIESRDVNNCTSLHLTAGADARQATQYLIFSGANVKAQTKEGDTPFLLAAKGGLQRMMELLLEHGAGIEETNFAGRTALLEAAALNDINTTHFLIGRGANIHARDRRGATALIIAVGHQNIDTVLLFLEKGLELEAASKDGTTAVLEAAESMSVAILKELIQKGANIEAKDSRGNTALLRGASAGWEAILKVLIHAGANIEAKNLKDETALDIAERSGRSRALDLLKGEVEKRKIAALMARG